LIEHTLLNDHEKNMNYPNLQLLFLLDGMTLWGCSQVLGQHEWYEDCEACVKLREFVYWFILGLGLRRMQDFSDKPQTDYLLADLFQ
jgi:hypothetical protein